MSDLNEGKRTKVKERNAGQGPSLNDLYPTVGSPMPLVTLDDKNQLVPAKEKPERGLGTKFKNAAKWVGRNKVKTALYASAVLGPQAYGATHDWSLFAMQTGAVGALVSAYVLGKGYAKAKSMYDDGYWNIIESTAVVGLAAAIAVAVGGVSFALLHVFVWQGDDTRRPAINLVEEFKGAPVGAVRQDAAGNRYEYSEAFVAQEMAKVDGKQLPVVTSGGKEVKKHFPVVRGNVTWDDSLTGKKKTREVLFCLPPVDGMPVMDGDKTMRAPTVPVGKKGAPKIKFVEGNNPSACLQ